MKSVLYACLLDSYTFSLFNYREKATKETKKESLKKSKLLLNKGAFIVIKVNNTCCSFPHLYFDLLILKISQKNKYFSGNKETEEEQEIALAKLDEWNISNDRFYESKKSSSDKMAVGLAVTLLQVGCNIDSNCRLVGR